MKILDDQAFSIKSVSESTETGSPKSQLWINGKAIDSIIEGVICEACINYGEFYLVFTTNDCPYEESLNIHFLDRNFRALDHAILVWPYSTGSFVLLDVIEPNLVTFKFFEDSIWEIELYSNKRVVVPYFSEPRGVWRSFKLKHYFKVSKKTASETAKYNLTNKDK